jgi:hypothetical protein
LNGLYVENERTWFCGQPSDEQAKFYRVAAQATDAAVAAAVVDCGRRTRGDRPNAEDAVVRNVGGPHVSRSNQQCPDGELDPTHHRSAHVCLRIRTDRH